MEKVPLLPMGLFICLHYLAWRLIQMTKQVEMQKLNLTLNSLLLLFTLLSCTKGDDFRGSGNVISQSRSVDSFTKIENSTSVNVVISNGNVRRVEVSADDNIINDVKTTVQNGVLKIDSSKRNYIDVTLTVSVTMGNLEELKNMGSGNMTVSDFEDLSTLEIDNEGSGSIIINGSGETLNLRNSGSGSYNGFGYIVQNCVVSNSGSGNCEINCTNELSGSNSGSGSIYYKNTSTVDITNSGSGIVTDVN